MCRELCKPNEPGPKYKMPYRHNREDSGRDFLAERIPRSKAQDKSERKEGPRGRPEVMRKRSSCRKEGEQGKNQGSSRKNSTRSGSRKNSARSASRKNSERSRNNTGDRRNYQPRSQSRPRTTQQEVLSLSPNFTSGDFRLLKLSYDCGE